MEVKQLWLLLVVMLVVIIQGCGVRHVDACLEEEKNGLLEIKASFNHLNGTFWELAYYWEESVDCCNWYRIQCNISTGRVISIDLRFARDRRFGGWYLNASLFLPFQQLNTLYLWGNGILGCIENEGFERLSTLDNFGNLHLSYNNFSNNILFSLGTLSSLKSLGLYENNLKGWINIQDLSNLTHLEDLNIGSNEIEGFQSFQDRRGPLNLSKLGLSCMYNAKSLLLQSLIKFPNLKTVSLRWNTLQGALLIPQELQNTSNLEQIFLHRSTVDDSFLQSFATLSSFKNLSFWHPNGSLPVEGLLSLKNLENLELLNSYHNFKIDNILQILGAMISLKTLSMRDCGFNDTIIITQGICKLNHLESLDIRNNNFGDFLPWCLANLTSLKYLNLGHNQFVGNISSSPLIMLISIEKLRFDDNFLRVPFSLGPFFNLSKLRIFSSKGNEIYEDEEVVNLIPSFQLEILAVSGHGYGGMFPGFLYHQHELENVSFSGIQILGEFPYWLLENNTKLRSLYLVNCSLMGYLQLPIRPHINLIDLDISNNHFNGTIPLEIGVYLPMLSFLNISKNGFHGSIPPSFGNLSSLRWLHINSNNFTGSIPNSMSQCASLKIFDGRDNHLSTVVSMVNMSSLKVLDLSNNMITGNLPFEFLPPMITEVHFSNNMIQGTFPQAFYNYTGLTILDLSQNNLTGKIPKWIDRFSQLNFLLLNHNNLNGEIPTQLCKLNKLCFINLSHNRLSGHIPPCLKSSSFLQYYGFSNSYHDEIDKEYSESFSKQALEFTLKSFSYSYQGSILIFISGIDLSHNNLTGEIPRELGNLTNIQVLNLSYNYLIGPIPPTFQYLKEIESLDLSNNILSGVIPPQLTQLYNLEVFSVAHNNLSGMTPQRVAQFATFEESSYTDNLFLCGQPLPKICFDVAPPLVPKNFGDKGETNGFIDKGSFNVTFVVTYIIVLLGIFVALYINPIWRGKWFYFIEVIMEICYYFMIDNLPPLSNFEI